MKPSFIIVGLGNPGREHEGTRHNIGFQAVHLLAEKFGVSPWKQEQKFEAEVANARSAAASLLLVKPLTFMNRSGEAVQKLINFYKLDPATQLLVLCDDVDLPIGELRIRKVGGPGTHNGLRSIVDHLGESFPRIRIGIGSPTRSEGSVQKAGKDLSFYVLSRPTAAEKKSLNEALTKVPEMVREFIRELH